MQACAERLTGPAWMPTVCPLPCVTSNGHPITQPNNAIWPSTGTARIAASRRCASSAMAVSRSQPRKHRPSCAHVRPVVPLPAYGSHTSSPGSEKSVTSSRRSPSGFCPGWHRTWSAVIGVPAVHALVIRKDHEPSARNRRYGCHLANGRPGQMRAMRHRREP
jgi:hypothetical protein